MLYIPISPPPELFLPAADSKNFASQGVSRPGHGTSDASRQIPSTINVKMIRDFSSGILKQLPSVVKMDRNMEFS
jgi:hypothetical protein